MVTNTLQTISKTEKEMEKVAEESSNAQDPSSQTAKEMCQTLEKWGFTALRAAEQWGTKALDKSLEKLEDIIL